MIVSLLRDETAMVLSTALNENQTLYAIHIVVVTVNPFGLNPPPLTLNPQP